MNVVNILGRVAYTVMGFLICLLLVSQGVI
jgi:hypothetical protein